MRCSNFAGNLFAIGDIKIEANIADSVNSTISSNGICDQNSNRSRNAKIEFTVIATSEVPAATLAGTLRNSTSAGTIKKPPPIPSRPVKTPTPEAATITATQLGLVVVDSLISRQHMAKAEPNIKMANAINTIFSGITRSSKVPKKVPIKPIAEKVSPTLTFTVPLLRRLIAPANAAAPTMIVELVVAAVADRPKAATKPGTAKIAPPAPISPNTLPTMAPSNKPKKMVICYWINGLPDVADMGSPAACQASMPPSRFMISNPLCASALHT